MQENDKTKQSDSIMYASRSDALPDHLRIAIAIIAGVGAVVGLHSLLSRRPDTIAVVEVEPLYKYGDKVDQLESAGPDPYPELTDGT